MKYTLILAGVIALGTNAQKCQKSTEIKPKQVDPLVQFKPKSATFPCDMGSPIPFGPVPTGCAKFEIIVARGTSEPGDLGMIVGDPVVARVKRGMPGVDVRGYPVQYSASLIGGSDGVKDIKDRIASQLKECPDEQFALVGYSQGGMLVASAAKGLAPEIQAKVLAVFLYGAGEGKNLRNLSTKTLANCAPGDFACPSAGTGPGHVSYNDEGTKWHDRSSAFLKSAFQGRSIGQKLMRDPTAALV